MRTSLCFLALLAVTAAAPAQTASSGPQQRLEVFVGNWTFEGEVKPGPAGGGGEVTGSEQSQKLGEAFIERHFEEKGAQDRRGVHVFGYDPLKRTYITSDFDSAGGFGSGTVTVSGSTWTFRETRVVAGRQARSRCAVTFAPEKTSFTVKCQVATQGNHWTPSFEGRWTKVR